MICPNCGCDSLRETMNPLEDFMNLRCVAECGCMIYVKNRGRITAKKKYIFKHKEQLKGIEYLYLDKFVNQYNKQLGG